MDYIIAKSRKREDEEFISIQTRYHVKATLLTDYIAERIEGMNSGRILKKGELNPVSKSTILRYGCLLRKIKRYEDAYDIRLVLEDIDMDFQQEFSNFCRNSGLLPNTIVGYLDMLHTVMKYAYEEKRTRSIAYRHSGFVPYRVETDHVYLNPTQIQEMHDLDISSREKIHTLIDAANMDEERKNELKVYVTDVKAKRMEESRDIFMVGCLTGQRISDFSRVSNDMFTKIKGVTFIRLTQKKTGKLVYIPLDVRVRKILAKYHGKLPHVFRTYISYNIKIVAELMGWTWEPNFDPSRIGRKAGTRFCDMLSTHTARRSFATNAYHAKVPLESIMSITGHETEKKLRVYLKLDEEEKGIMAAHDFEGVIK